MPAWEVTLAPHPRVHPVINLDRARRIPTHL
jgi:hypothetical protein